MASSVIHGGIESRIASNFRVLNIYNGTSYNTILQDLIANSGTLSDTTFFNGVHVGNGTRAYMAYLYKNKDYGACFTFEYSGLIRFQYLNKGTISEKML